jgi:uncharacterized protein (TIGR03083 family)
MDARQHLDHLRSDAATLVAACRAEPDAPIAACPGWDRATLAKHVCVPLGWSAVQAEAGPDEKRGFRDAPRPAEGDDVCDFLEGAVERAIAAMSAMDPAAAYPTWAGPQPAGWLPRRMAHEVAIHRFDAAGGSFDAGLAVDGIDELLDVFAPLLGADRFGGESTTLHLHSTDRDDGEWLVALGPERLTAERRHAKGDAALRAPASDLYLFAWNRVPLDDRFEVIGDRAAAERWRATVSF